MAVRRFDGAEALDAAPGSTLVAIGNFDGVHRGHRDVLSVAVATAAERGLVPVVLTFHPHPSEVLGRGRQAALTDIDRKVDLLCRIAPSLAVVVQPFDTALAQMSPRQFVSDLLVDELGTSLVIVGENFRFGKGRAGDLSVLSALGAELGFEARAESLTGDAAGALSSSRVRQAIAAGDLVGAEAVLGRPHSISGTVVEGHRRGRTIGVPTANLSGVVEALPSHGVYACVVDVVHPSGEAEQLASGVANIGDRPTVAGGFSVEVHLFDFDRDLYGQRLRVHLTDRLRAERAFDGLDALKAQIAIDIDAARAKVAARLPAPDASGAWY